MRKVKLSVLQVLNTRPRYGRIWKNGLVLKFEYNSGSLLIWDSRSSEETPAPIRGRFDVEMFT